jgi:hypothetical protein
MLKARAAAVILVGSLSLIASDVRAGALPYPTFTSGQVISSSQIQANFAALADRKFVQVTTPGQSSVTVPSGATEVMVEAIGGGGGGSGNDYWTTYTSMGAGAHGKSGHYVKGMFTLTGTGTITVTIGTGGGGGACGDMNGCTTAVAGSPGNATTVSGRGVNVIAPGGLGGLAPSQGATTCNDGNQPSNVVPSGAVGGYIAANDASEPGLSSPGSAGSGGAESISCNAGDSGQSGIVILTFQ